MCGWQSDENGAHNLSEQLSVHQGEGHYNVYHCEADNVTLQIPNWLLAFFTISRGLYIYLKLRLHTYYPGEDKNEITIQTSILRQALGRSDLVNTEQGD